VPNGDGLPHHLDSILEILPGKVAPLEEGNTEGPEIVRGYLVLLNKDIRVRRAIPSWDGDVAVVTSIERQLSSDRGHFHSGGAFQAVEQLVEESFGLLQGGIFLGRQDDLRG
jgi:hypothetical protein